MRPTSGDASAGVYCVMDSTATLEQLQQLSDKMEGLLDVVGTFVAHKLGGTFAPIWEELEERAVR